MPETDHKANDPSTAKSSAPKNAKTLFFVFSQINNQTSQIVPTEKSVPKNSITFPTGAPNQIGTAERTVHKKLENPST